MKTGFPAWLPAVLYLLVSLFFPQPLHSILGLLCSVILFLASTTAGGFLSKVIGNENGTLHFPLGLGALLLLIFALGSWNASSVVMIPVWCGLSLLALPSLKEFNSRIPYYCLWGLPYFILFVLSSYTPTTFYDSLAYNLGLPYQYLSAGRFMTFAEKSTSFFPPFDQVSKYLFLLISPQNGIKLFSFFLYIHSLRVLNHMKPENLDSRFIVIPLLLLPVPWILMHLINPDLMACLFYVSGVSAILSGKGKNVLLAAVLFAFSAWTKYTIYPFLLFLPLLFADSKAGIRQFLKKTSLFASVFLIILSPLLIRNMIQKKDPFYPMLAPVLSTDWQDNQIAAVQKEFPVPENWQDRVKAIFLTPLRLTFNVKSYGSASEVGMLPLLALMALPFYVKKITPSILGYVLICYLMWVLKLYQFRYFLPVFLIFCVWLGQSFQLVRRLAPRAVPVLWVAGIIAGLFVSLPVYRIFPLISRSETQEAYLSRNLNFFPAAGYLNRSGTARPTLFVGETRTAYLVVPLIAPSYADQHPLLLWTKEAKDSEALYKRVKAENIEYILHNPAELQRLAQKYQIWRGTKDDSDKITIFLQNHGRVVFSERGIQIFQIN